MLNNGGVSGQIYAARALMNMAADAAVQDQMVALGAVPHFVGIIRDNVGAAPAAAGAVEKLAGQPRFAAAIIRQGGVSALVGLLNAGARDAFLPTMRSLKHLSGAACVPDATDLFGILLAWQVQVIIDQQESCTAAPAGLDPNVANVIVRAEGVPPLVRRSAKGSTDVRLAALPVLRDVAKNGYSLVDAGGSMPLPMGAP